MFSKLSSKLTPPRVFGILFAGGCMPFVIYVLLRLTFSDRYSTLLTFFKLNFLYAPPSAIALYVIGWSIGRFYYDRQHSLAQKWLPATILAATSVSIVLFLTNIALWLWAANASEAEVETLWTYPIIKSSRMIVSEMAENPNSSAKVLDEMVTYYSLEANKNVEILKSIAKNPNLSKEGYLKLEATGDASILAEVATNPKQPPELALRSARRGDLQINKNLAQNPSADPALLEVLAKSGQHEVHTYVARHPNTNASTLEDLMADDDESIRKYIASNPNTPESVLGRLVQDASGEVRYYLTKNPKTPDSLLEKLVEDSDIRAQNTARGRLGR